MMKRILTGLVAVAVVAVLAGAGVLVAKFDELKWYLSSPRVHYGDMERTTPPVYFFEEQWAAHPARKDGADLVPAGFTDNQATAKADVFFVHGTAYFGDKWIGEAHDADAETIINGPLMAMDASAFNGCCRVFAPRYRMAQFAAIEQTTGDGRNALELAYTDIVRAFDSYIMEDNGGRPFILVGHDQGAILVQRLMDLRITPDTRISERLVAAYLIGGGIALNRFQGSFKRLHPCATSTDSFCVVAWETFVEGTDPRAHPNATEAWDTRAWTFLNEEARVCTNPLTWTMDATAPASANLGALPVGIDIGLGINRMMGAIPTANVGRYKALPELKPAYTGATCRDGFLMVPKPKDSVFTHGWRGTGNLHLSDITLFWANIRQNTIERVEAFVKDRPAYNPRAL